MDSFIETLLGVMIFSIFGVGDHKVGKAIDIYMNNKLVAKGEVMFSGESLGITIIEIIKSNRSQGYI